MLSRPVPRFPSYSSPHPTPTPHPPAYPHHPHGLSMDPSSVDFRAFYPYTPNEVKHRKRTSPSQLRVLESVFKRDTKPNGPLRVQLAAELGMNPRGVQVWFQNRRAKEKGKASKAAKADQREPQDHPESPDDATESPPEALADVPEPRDSSSSPEAASPPSLQVVTEPSTTSWAESTVDQHSLYVDPNLHAFRRGSLPVNAFPASNFSSNSPPHYDSFDPLARRLSVDASLQRLASNPYAHLARAKNGAIYGPRAIAPNRHRPLGRTPYAPPTRIASSASMPYRLDVRRASLGNFRFSPQSTASPSPSPLSPYHGVRASLPDHSLYAVSSRTVSSPIPGPLPSPNFSFGAANTPSMVSGSSGDSERNSPDSSQSYTYRESEQDEDEGAAASYYSLSRFGSITSIATSDSSIHSAYYPEVVGCYPEREQDLSGRRDSCASGHFTSLMSNLDVNGVQEPMASPQDHDVYTLHEDVNVVGAVMVASNGTCVETATYPSPASTISPGPSGSPHSQGTTPSVPISRSSELNHALQSQSDQVQMNNPADQPSFVGDVIVASPPAPAIETVISPSGEQYFYAQDASHSQATTLQAAPVEFSHKYNYDYDASFTESYPPSLLEGDSDIGMHRQAFEPPSMTYDAMGQLETTVHYPDHYIAYA
ncbi:hypothetical protein D9615_004545 [Tricholomella constricta]|uniref:Homeobox domain-containing protein n=1 Tax=Tricholomella constricta TaxID=117010 RepID=A0A8H5HCE9_9AGAR|nr:hypothetical protein D9615_004545 [Tricholomella constricta]